MNVRQTAWGSGNTQITKIFNRGIDVVDICSDKIRILIEKIVHVDFQVEPESRLIPPDIVRKNILNCIDSANSLEIDQTYAVWDDISLAVSIDATGKLANEYKTATMLLNTLYLAKFQKDFPLFKLHVISIYCETTDGGADDAYLLVHLLHYMYLSCQIGIIK